MRFRYGYIAIFCLIGLSACQPVQETAQDVPAVLTVPAVKPTPVAEAALPTELSEPLRAAFAENPQLTAQRFLAAYDDFSESGPVTRQRVKDLAQFRRAYARSELLGNILAMDINGDTEITRAEVDLALTLPGWSNKPAAIEGLFESDIDQDEIISVEEAILYSRDLHARREAATPQPIGNFLMLSDLDKDDIVTRDEMTRYLLGFLAKS